MTNQRSFLLPFYRRGLRPVIALVVFAALTSCGAEPAKNSDPAGMNHMSEGMSHDVMSSSSSSPEDTTGLASEQAGYRLAAADQTLAAGQPLAYRFTIIGPDAKPVTKFAVDQTKQLHFYAIRTDLTGFQHLHPRLENAGQWTADLAGLQPGDWRFFTSFTPDSGPGAGKEFVLSTTAKVPGNATLVPLPKASSTASVDGFTVTINGNLKAGSAQPFDVTITNQDGKPVTDLEQYLGTYAHLTGFHADDQAIAHFHPMTMESGPTLMFHAELPKPGNWRLFVQFQTAGQLHTTALTVQAS